MKTYTLKALLFLAVSSACSKNNSILPEKEPDIVIDDSLGTDTTKVPVDPPGTIYVDGKAFDAQRISVEHEGTYKITTNMFTSKIDTSWNTDSTAISWSIMVPENESVTAKWSIDADFKYTAKEKKVWNYQQQKWIYTFLVDVDKKIPGNGEVKIIFTNDKTKEIFDRKFVLNLELKKHSFDVYRTTFGMTKDEVKTNEVARVIDSGNNSAPWNELLPTVAYGFHAKFWGGMLTYEYKDGKLALVSEVNLYYPKNGSKSHLNRLLDYLQAPGKPKVSWPTPETMTIEEPYTWNYAGLKITLQEREYVFNGETIKANALTYEKGN